MVFVIDNQAFMVHTEWYSENIELSFVQMLKHAESGIYIVKKLKCNYNNQWDLITD